MAAGCDQKASTCAKLLGCCFSALVATIYMKCEVPCNRVISYAGGFFILYIQVSPSEDKQCDSERRAGDV